MRKVFLEQNLGKKSKCRFLKRNQKQVVIKLMIESQKAVSTPALTQPLVISGVPVIDFCDKYNQLSKNFEEGLLIRSRTTVNQISKTFDLELMTPSVNSLLHRILVNQKFNKIKNLQLSQIIYNISLIKSQNSNLDQSYLSDLVGFFKQIAGNFKSYQNRTKRIKWQHITN